MREIPLTQGKVAFVDDEDYELISKFKWFAERRKHTWYAARNVKMPDGCRRVRRMHQEILDVQMVDHCNRNGLDNRRQNLRPATRVGNGANSWSSRNKSGYRGVSWSKAAMKWRAVIGFRYIGVFSDPREAAKAYDKEAKAKFGDFAALNFRDAA